MHKVYLGLGSNLNSPIKQIRSAIKAIGELPGTNILKTANLYESKPVGPQDQPNFINTAIAIETEKSPLELLDELQAIEKAQGRIKLRHWGERNIDIDILLFDQLEFSTERLTIPHAQLKQRDFVLKPLLDLQPDLALPSGEKVAGLIKECPDNGLQVL